MKAHFSSSTPMSLLAIFISCTFFTQSAYAQKERILRDLGTAGMLFLGTEVAKNVIKIGVDRIIPTTPTKEAPEPRTVNNDIFNPSGSPFAPKLTYVGSLFQCEDGCKYYWSQETGWRVFSNGAWKKIREPGGNVVRTHNIYYVNGKFLSEPVQDSYGYAPGYGWGYF
jgi:hypothetical protein